MIDLDSIMTNALLTLVLLVERMPRAPLSP